MSRDAFADHRKVTIYLPEPDRKQLEADAELTDRSVSWLLRRAYRHVRAQVLAEAGGPWKER